MKSKIILKVLVLILVSIFLLQNVALAANAIVEEQDNTVINTNKDENVNEQAVGDIESGFELTYKYNEDYTKVTVTVKSNLKLKDTKPSWTLVDEYTYTKDFTSNTKYSTAVEDIDGNIYDAQIDISQIKTIKPGIEVTNTYSSDYTKVTVTVKSNFKIKHTKPSWKLVDEYTYTKEFTANTNYSTAVEDINGNVFDAKINITDIGKIKPGITVTNEYNEDNSKVIVTIKSNFEIKDTKPSWKLSADKYTYTKEFIANTVYSTAVEDVHGNIFNAKINITNIGKVKPEITVTNTYSSDYTKVTVTIKSKTKIKHTKPSWTLVDEYTYKKDFFANTSYSTAVEDVDGNILDAKINITEIVKIEPGITVTTKYNDENNTVTVKVVSKLKLKNTKPSWKLVDEYTYTKDFVANTVYTTTFEDQNGNIFNGNIEITQIDNTAPEIKLNYVYNSDGTITVNAVSNEKLGETKPSWTLSEDKLTYSKVFSSETNYSTGMEDIYGNSTIVTIKLKSKENIYRQTDSTIKVRYLYTSYETVTVQVISTVKLKNTKATWTLSEDGYTYTNIFDKNTMYTTAFTNENGNTYDINIIITYFGNYLHGIDVSAHNGKINWNEVKANGIDFAIIRCGYGKDDVSQDDTYFNYNIKECERLGIPYGIYLYSYALDTESAVSEAAHVLRLVKGHNPKYGIWIDMEDADGYKQRNGMPSNDTLVAICNTFIQEIQKNGYGKVGTYASLNWLNNQLNSPILDAYDKWVAQWASNCTYTKKYCLWQYTSKGSVSGILGNVDMDIYYN